MTCQLLALCIDAIDPLRLARFWSGVLGSEIAGDSRAGVTLRRSDDTGFGIRFLPAQGKELGPNLGHLHLTSTSLEDQQQTVTRSIGLGARPVDVGQRPEEGHVVLADPEGNSFCVIEPGNRWLAGCGFLAELTCDGSREVGYFWSKALGWPLVWDQGLQTAIRSPHGGPKISWDSWDDAGMTPKSGKNRLHFDLAPADGDQQGAVDRLVSLGATRVDIDHDESSRVVMNDPDGRRFCVLPPHPQLLTPEEKLADAKKLLSLPRIVVICGSTRFMTEMTEADLRETKAGRIVVKPGCDMKSPHELWSDPVEAEALKFRLDDLHRAKIRLADEVLVVGDYIGDSTRAEIAYARSLGKPVRFTHPEVDPDA